MDFGSHHLSRHAIKSIVILLEKSERLVNDARAIAKDIGEESAATKLAEIGVAIVSETQRLNTEPQSNLHHEDAGADVASAATA